MLGSEIKIDTDPTVSADWRPLQTITGWGSSMTQTNTENGKKPKETQSKAETESSKSREQEEISNNRFLQKKKGNKDKEKDV